MSTSSTYTFNPTLEQILSEAWERCGLDPADLTARHAISARRSLNLLLRSELSADQINLWTVTERTVTPSESDNSFALSQGALDILEAVSRDSDGNDTPMIPIGRADWLEIPDKDQEGSRPDRFWVEKSGTNTGTHTAHFWQAADDSGFSIIINELFSIEDAGDLDNEPAVPALWFDVVCAGLAKRLAEKWAPERADRLEVKFMQAHRLAKQSNIERSSLIICPSYGNSWGRR